MSAPTKFLFDDDFAGGGARPAGGPTVPLAEHQVKLAEAEAAGRRAGMADAKAQADRRVAETLERIGARLAESAGALQTIEARLECEAVEVAVAVARKLAPALIAREPFAEIAELASNCFKELMTAPHIAVRVNDALYAAAREKLEDIARAKSFEGRLVVLAEPEVAIGDCRIEWADGGINRDSATADAAIGEAVSAYLTARRNFAGTHETHGTPGESRR
jgi:flagellar assembly protein FliH